LKLLKLELKTTKETSPITNHQSLNDSTIQQFNSSTLHITHYTLNNSTIKRLNNSFFVFSS